MNTKRLIIFLLLVCLINNLILADEGPVSYANQQLRNMFSQLVHHTNFLYDRSAHIIDEAYFSTNCSLTTNCSVWYFAYQEMYNSAKDQTQMLPPETVVSMAYNYESDTVSIGIIDYAFDRLRPNVFNHNYFEFDTVNNILTRRIYQNAWDQTDPYTSGEIFMVAPVVEATHTLTPVFSINDIVFIDDIVRSQLNSVYYSLKINFNDGSGVHTISSLDTTNYIQVSYPEPGEYEMTTYMYCHDCGDILLKESKSTIIVGNAPTVDILDDYEVTCEQRTEWQDMRVFEYTSNCNYNPEEEKIIFVLAGYNPGSFQKFNKRKPEELYKKYIIDGNMENLPSFGYKFVIVDWEYPNDDIRTNAERFMYLLNNYKCEAQNEEQFVVIGHSMGCLIGRYALTAMETIWNTDCMSEKKHNTRLFISNDGPHQGVNIPMSVQTIYGDALGTGGYLRWLTDFMDVASFGKIDFSNTLLNGTSVKQMLNRHYSTGIESDFYTAADEFYDFFSSLDTIGNYPQYCKLVALSNGSMEGLNQQNVYYDEENDTYYGYTNDFRYPNDHIFYMENQLNFRVLGLDFGTDFYIDLHSNPEGSGLLFNMYYGIHKPQINLYWFGVNINTVFEGSNYTRYGNGLLPYCVAPGGSEYVQRDERRCKQSWGLGLNVLNLFGLDMSVEPGSTFAMYTRVGIPWLLDISDDLVLHTDGLGFGFVPIRSAFDYGSFNDSYLNIDFTQIPVQNIMQDTPFDVLIGRVNNECGVAFNGNHEDVLNPILEYNTNNLPYNGEVAYNFCGNMYKCLLNAEIGDDELYLDNNDLIWNARVSAYNSVHYGEQAPYYTYYGSINSDYELEYKHPTVGAISRNDPYNVSAYLMEYSNSPSGTSSYWYDIYHGDICCFPYHPRHIRQHLIDADAYYNESMLSDENKSFVVSPTILSNGQTIQISLPYESNWKLTLISMSGSNITTTHCNSDMSTIKIPTSLKSGMYILYAFSNIGETFRSKIIIQ